MMSTSKSFKQVVSDYCKPEEIWWNNLPEEWPNNRESLISTLTRANVPKENIDDLVEKLINKIPANVLKTPNLRGTYDTVGGGVYDN